MGIISGAINNLLVRKGFDWAYCVISYIAEKGNRYDGLIQSYQTVSSYLNTVNGKNKQPQTMELITLGNAPLPNGGNADFAFCYRNVSENTLYQNLQNSVKNVPFTKQTVLVCIPTLQLCGTENTDILFYKIENMKVVKI
ncbi:MAG: hypothetical protein LBP19_09680 [Treponema sp.]|jgi:hypothetical protein|nr:hypothetical protein [Treponema sp.]